MKLTGIVWLLGVTYALCGAAAARAGTISANFTGIVTGSEVTHGPPGPPGNINGDLVTGTFTATDDGCTGAFGFCDGEVSITLNVAGLQMVYAADQGIGFIRVSNSPGSQTVSFENYAPYDDAAISLAGPADAFIDGTDYSTLNLGPVEGASGTFMYGRALQGGFTITTIDGVPIPEPTSLLLLFSGLLGAAAVRRAVQPRQLAGGWAMWVANTAPLSASTSRSVTS